MNLQTSPVLRPLRVLIVNPLSPSAQLVIQKILSGSVFGRAQLVDLIMLVYSNERQAADGLKLDLYCCAFSCMNSIVVSSDLPILTDAEVFCFITNFKNPNSIDITTNIDHDLFDALYLVIKIVNNLTKCSPIDKTNEVKPKGEKKEEPGKPIIMVDGLVAMNILTVFLKDIPSDMFFFPTQLPTLARVVLGGHLKVQCNVINEVLVWAASDDVFHIEVEKPLIMQDKVNKPKCVGDAIGQDTLKCVVLDHTQFNDSWLKKELIDKVKISASKNPYGCIYRAAEYAQALSIIWKARGADKGREVYASLGVVSDGSLHTIKGRAYILPLVFSGENWSVNKRFEETSHLQQEIKRLNKFVKIQYEKLRPFCKKFLEENVINQAFVPDDNETDSVYSFVYRSRASINT